LSFSYQDNFLFAESVNIADLANIYQTPLYIYSQQAIENNYRTFDNAFGAQAHLICYAVKANSNLAVLSTLAQLGSGFDIVSLGELERVLAAGGSADKIVFSGVAKTHTEIQRALEVGIKCFNVESSAEMHRIEQVAKNCQKIAAISLRVNPNVDAKTHPYISTGLKENKFGVAIDDSLALYQFAHHSKHLCVQGIDCHIGSQITELSPFLDALDKVLALIKQLQSHDIHIKHLDLGGGVGIQYRDEVLIDIQDYVHKILAKTQNLEVLLEPGRAIVGNAGVFVTQVEFLKQNPDKSFAIIDGAMNDLMRPTLYGAYHQVLPIDNTKSGECANWDIVGPICETGDFLAKDRQLCLKQGDYLALMSAGAYGFTMSSNYNSRPRVAEIMVSGTHHQLVRKRETIQDLFANESLNTL
jgi:diaminopimelate decarboxylase